METRRGKETISNCNLVQVCLLSAQAGGAGLNLIGANRLILLDSNWCTPTTVPFKADQC